jgi:choline monooxygenase
VPEDQRGIFDHSSLKAFDKTDHALYPVHAAELGCLVLVCLAPEAPVLADVLGDLPRRFDGYRLDEWDLVTTREYVIEANWKLIGENFMEYYHLPWVHPGLVKVSPMKAHHRWQGRGMYVGFGTSPIATNADEGGWQGLPPISGLDDEQAVSARFVWLFPNVAVNVLPNHVVLLLVRPVTPTRTVETLYLLAHPESRTAPGAQAEIEQLLEFWDVVNREDVAIVERVQEGLANLAYTGGRLCYRFEEGVHRFQNLVVDHVLGEPRVPEGDAQDGQPMFAAG